MPKLEIDISARLASFQDGLDRVESSARKSVSQMQSLFTGLGASLATIGAGLSIGAISDAFRSTVDSMAKLDDAAEQTGVSVEQLSGLLNTLRPSGASLEQITDIAGKLQKSMAGADEETSKSAEAFKALGIETRDSAGNLRAVDDVLTELAEKLATYADGTNKVAIVQAILGKSGAAYLPILKDLAGTAREAGTVTAEQAAEAERLQKAFGALKVQADAFAQSLASSVIPRLADLITAYAKARKEGLGLFDALDVASPGFGSRQAQLKNEERLLADLVKKREYFAKQTEAAGGKVGGETALDRDIKQQERKVELLRNELGLEKARADLQNTQLRNAESRGFDPLARQAPSISSDDSKKKEKQLSDGERLIQQLTEQLYTQQKVNAATRLELDIALGKYEKLTPAEADRARALARQIDALNAAADAEKKRLEVLKEQEQLQKQQDEAYKREQDGIEKLAEGYRDLIDPTRAYVRELENIERLRKIGGDSGGLFSDEAEAARRALNDKVARQIGGVTKETKTADDAVKQLGLTFTSAFEDAVAGGKDLKAVLQSLAQDITKIFLRQYVTTPLVNGITGLFGSGKPTISGDLSQPVNTYMPSAATQLQSARDLPPIIVNVDSRADRSAVMKDVQQVVRNELGRVADRQQRGGAAVPA